MFHILLGNNVKINLQTGFLTVFYYSTMQRKAHWKNEDTLPGYLRFSCILFYSVAFR